MMPIDTSAAAFLAGLVTSVHCVGMCGPLSCSWAVSAAPGSALFFRDTGLYHAGRLLSYGLVGALAGALGVAPLGFFQRGAGLVLPWLLVLAFAIVGFGLDQYLPKPGFLARPLRRLQAAAFRLKSGARAGLLGLATPLLPCGPLYLIFGLALANGSALNGAGFTVAFGLGTLPLLWLAQTGLHRLGGVLSPTALRRLQRGFALGTALLLAWRLRGTLDFSGETLPGCCHG
jgi:sulfite exporter TauE/SafE